MAWRVSDAVPVIEACEAITKGMIELKWSLEAALEPQRGEAESP